MIKNGTSHFGKKLCTKTLVKWADGKYLDFYNNDNFSAV